MAKKKKSEEVKEIIEAKVDELLGGEVAIEVKDPEVVAQIIPQAKEKKFIGYHPITGKEIYE